MVTAIKRLEEKATPVDALKMEWMDAALAAFRRAYDSQQGGFASIILLLVLGLIGLSFVKGGGRQVEP